MITKYEITATSEEARQIKHEVYGLDWKSCFKVNIKKIDGYDQPKKVWISYYEPYQNTLEMKCEALRELKMYCDRLRERMFYGKLI